MKKIIITAMAFVVLGCFIACERTDGVEDGKAHEAVTSGEMQSGDSTEHAKTDEPNLTDQPSSGEEGASDSDPIKWTGVH